VTPSELFAVMGGARGEEMDLLLEYGGKVLKTYGLKRLRPR
jgi:hypothetical protein